MARHSELNILATKEHKKHKRGLCFPCVPLWPSLFLLASCLLCSCRTGMTVTKTMVAARASSAVNIDGVLDEEDWSRAVPYGLFFSCDRADGQVQPEEGGIFKLLRDENNIYLAGRFKDLDVLATGEADDMPHYKLGDVCEIFLKPQDYSWYWEILLTPRGKKTGIFWAERKQKPADGTEHRRLDLEYAANIEGTLNASEDEDGGWSFEVGIPLTELANPGRLNASGDWTILVARQNYFETEDGRQREFSMCPRLTRTDFHNAEEYGLLKLAE
ncbi:MAG: carbohydrate-binding family 9-like protein [Verrucomicrobiota bacterium]